MYIFGRDVLLKIEGYNYRNGEPTDFRDPVTFFVNIVYPNTRPFLNSDAFAFSSKEKSSLNSYIYNLSREREMFIAKRHVMMAAIFNWTACQPMRNQQQPYICKYKAPIYTLYSRL